MDDVLKRRTTTDVQTIYDIIGHLEDETDALTQECHGRNVSVTCELGGRRATPTNKAPGFFNGDFIQVFNLHVSFLFQTKLEPFTIGEILKEYRRMNSPDLKFPKKKRIALTPYSVGIAAISSHQSRVPPVGSRNV